MWAVLASSPPPLAGWAAGWLGGCPPPRPPPVHPPTAPTPLAPARPASQPYDATSDTLKATTLEMVATLKELLHLHPIYNEQMRSFIQVGGVGGEGGWAGGWVGWVCGGRRVGR